MRSKNRIFKSVSSFLVCAMLSMPVWALDLTAAKDSGLVGETPSGYLAPVSDANGDVQALINDINAKRKAVYQESAKKNKISLEAVEKLAGKKAIEKTQSGHYIQINGKWQKK